MQALRLAIWNVGLAICGIITVYLTWEQFTAYKERQRFQVVEAMDRQTRVAKLSVDGCDSTVAALVAMEHRLLKAGGMQVPQRLAKDIELCLDEGIMSSQSRQRMEQTRLIRLFPVQY